MSVSIIPIKTLHLVDFEIMVSVNLIKGKSFIPILLPILFDLNINLFE